MGSEMRGLWILGSRPGSLFWILTCLAYLWCRVCCESPEDPLNACDLPLKPPTFLFCNCNEQEAEEATSINCMINDYMGGREGAPEWDAVAKAVQVQQFIFMTRDKIDAFPPPRIFRNMLDLAYVEVKSGRIGTVPRFAFANSSSLVHVQLPDNGIRELVPLSFANMAQLKELWLGGNRIGEIGKGVFRNLPSLKALYLERNALRLLHAGAFEDLSSLLELELHENNLSAITPDVFLGLKGLKRLDLRRNSITFLGHHVFSQMEVLGDLDISDNQINAVSPTAFAGLKGLTRLNLRGNRVVSFPPATFAHSHKIHFLDLRNNVLETIALDAFQEVYENLKEPNMQFMVEGNRLQCDCRIGWMSLLWEETKSDMVRNHLNQTICDVPQKYSRTYEEEDAGLRLSRSRALGNVTLISGPVEETTTYFTEPVLKVVHLSPAKCEVPEETTTVRPAKGNGKKGKDRQRSGGKSAEQSLTQESLTGKTSKEPLNDSPSAGPRTKVMAGLVLISLGFSLS